MVGTDVGLGVARREGRAFGVVGRVGVAVGEPACATGTSPAWKSWAAGCGVRVRSGVGDTCGVRAGSTVRVVPGVASTGVELGEGVTCAVGF
jgi:hypothetical protein